MCRRSSFKLKKKLRRKCLPTLSKLNKKLWSIFSEYIRRKDADDNGMVRCFTCGKYSHWKTMDAGHYIPKSISLSLRFDERNVKPQDTACNRFRHGNLTQYALGLEKLYGSGILEELDNEKHRITKYYRCDYEEMIKIYEIKLKDLDGDILGAR